MNHPFLQYLINRDLVNEAASRCLIEGHTHVREPIGMIAVQHGLLNPTQIDTILDRQRESAEKSRFGEIAVELGFLTTEQVDTLVKIQDFRAAGAITEALALAGVLRYDVAVRYLGGYFANDDEVIAMMSEQ